MKTLQEKIKDEKLTSKALGSVGSVAYNRGLKDVINIVENHTCECLSEQQRLRLKLMSNFIVEYCPRCQGRIIEK